MQAPRKALRSELVKAGLRRPHLLPTSTSKLIRQLASVEHYQSGRANLRKPFAAAAQSKRAMVTSVVWHACARPPGCDNIGHVCSVAMCVSAVFLGQVGYEIALDPDQSMPRVDRSNRSEAIDIEAAASTIHALPTLGRTNATEFQRSAPPTRRC